MAFLNWRALLVDAVARGPGDKIPGLEMRCFCETLCLGQIPPEWKGVGGKHAWMEACHHVFASLIQERLASLAVDGELAQYAQKDAGVKPEARRRYPGTPASGPKPPRRIGDRRAVGKLQWAPGGTTANPQLMIAKRGVIRARPRLEAPLNWQAEGRVLGGSSGTWGGTFVMLWTCTLRRVSTLRDSVPAQLNTTQHNTTTSYDCSIVPLLR